MEIKEAIAKLVDSDDLSMQDAGDVMNQIMGGSATDAQIAAFLVALRLKGETIDEITACARVMREKAAKISPAGPLLDVVGTGGDSSGTFNISTASAFVAAGCGIGVAKHGNKGVSSKSGSADVLSALGVNIGLEPGQVEACINEVGIGFMFAPKFHPAMRYAIGPRKEVGIRTIFNILGPLTNPAGAEYELMGVFDEKLIRPLAEVLGKLGCRHALVVHGSGMDEVALAPTAVAEYRDGQVKAYTITAEDLGLRAAPLTDLRGGTPEENAETILGILKGEINGPKRDIVLANSGAALVAAEKAHDFRGGVAMAAKSIDDGLALEKLEKLKEFTNAG
ncbi:MAG: anthranilate phosphoribosyltransferase [archaeon]